MPIPILWISDAPTASSGFGRVTRDICTLLASMPEFRVASLGYGGAYSRHLPFPQYTIQVMKDWVINDLQAVWHDFAGDEKGIVMCCWDASRVGWMVNPPETLPFAEWMSAPPFKLWTYSPVDAEGPNGKLAGSLKETLSGFDRVLNYTKFSANVTGYPDYLPHGIHTGVFRPIPNGKARFRKYGFSTLKDDDLLIGIVATNQTRKDWALGIQTAALLRDRGHSVKLWCHTDVVKRHWDLEQLVNDYGLFDITAVTSNKFPDEQLAELYSACDVTLGIGSEGFGFPIAESLACGTPVVTGNYAGQTDFVQYWMSVNPVAYHYDTIYCWKRPVFDPIEWADRVEELTHNKKSGESLLIPELNWANLAPRWREWFRAGLKNLQWQTKMLEHNTL